MRFLKKIWMTVFPPRCVNCGAGVQSEQALCPDCFRRLRFLRPPLCPWCGQPWAAGAGLCPMCRRKKTGAPSRSVFVYDAFSKDLIFKLKFFEYMPLIPLLTHYLSRESAAFDETFDMVVPVPLHKSRLRQRGFNQSAVLAKHVARRLGVKHAPFALQKPKAAAAQKYVKFKDRRQNVAGTFRASAKVAGKKILLIDDVITTGATSQEAARTLLKAGAERVCVLTVARTVLSDPES